jgi:bacteriorhodopsin
VSAASVALQAQGAAWAQGLLPEWQLYWYTAGLMAVFSVIFLLWTTRLSSHRRRYGLLVVYTSLVLMGAYAGMANALLRFESIEGAAVPVMRFVGYAFGTTTILFVTGHVGGFSRRLQVAMVIPFLGITGGTLGGWFFEPPLSQVASVSTLLSLPLIAYIFFGPGARAAAEKDSARRLLYGKLRNVELLAWLGYLVVGVLSRQNLALLDGFVGVFIGLYVDVALYLGFGLLLLRSGDALDSIAGVDAESSSRSDAGSTDNAAASAD